MEKEKNWTLNFTVDKIKSWTHPQLGFDLFTYTCDQTTRVLSQAREEERGPWKRDGRPCQLMRNTLLHLWALYTRGCFPVQNLMSTKLVNCVRHWKTLSLFAVFFRRFSVYDYYLRYYLSVSRSRWIGWHFPSILGGKSVAIVITGIPSYHTIFLSVWSKNS